MGSMISLGRLNSVNYRADRSLKKLIEAAPFGLDAKTPIKNKTLYRGIIKGINKDDFILIWNGGIWNWNDGLTLIKAMDRLKGKKIKLIFQGFKHPNSDVKMSQAAKQCLKLAIKLKLKDKNVYFIDSWVPYRDRADFLLESDIGLVSSPDIPEANLFFKTRIYDHFWAGLPSILNDCEAFAPLIEQRGLGLVAKTGDPESWATNILALYNNPKLIKQIKQNIQQYRNEINWQDTLQPLAHYFAKPYHAADKEHDNSMLVEANIRINRQIIEQGI